MAIFFIFIQKKQLSLLLNGEVIWQVSDSSLAKDLHGRGTFCNILGHF